MSGDTFLTTITLIIATVALIGTIINSMTRKKVILNDSISQRY